MITDCHDMPIVAGALYSYNQEQRRSQAEVSPPPALSGGVIGDKRGVDDDRWALIALIFRLNQLNVIITIFELRPVSPR